MEYRDEKATRLQTIFIFEETEINSAVKNVINKLLSQHTRTQLPYKRMSFTIELWRESRVTEASR